MIKSFMQNKQILGTFANLLRDSQNINYNNIFFKSSYSVFLTQQLRSTLRFEEGKLCKTHVDDNHFRIKILPIK